MTEQNDRQYSTRALLVTALVSIIGTVTALEMAGRIEHNTDKDQVTVGEFKAVYLGPREDYRMSPKSSELHAECYRGYLGVGSDTDETLKGILVDYKNRGIRCGPTPEELKKLQEQTESKEVPDDAQG